MNEQIAMFEQWFRVCLFITAVCTTIFPTLWAFSPWHETVVGRLIMIRSIAFALAMDLMLYHLLWGQNPRFKMMHYLLEAIVFGVISIVSVLLTHTMLNRNYFYNRKARKMSENTPEPVLGEAPPSANVWLSNKTYDRLKFLTQIILPGAGTLYVGLALLWGFPEPEKVSGSIVVITTFLGLFLGASTKQYMNTDARFDGTINVSPDPDDENATNLNVQLDPAAIVDKDEVVVKVNKRNLP